MIRAARAVMPGLFLINDFAPGRVPAAVGRRSVERAGRGCQAGRVFQ